MIVEKGPKRIILLVFLSCQLAMLTLNIVKAQAPVGSLVINHVDVQEQEDVAELSLYFTPLANDGRPLPRPTIESLAVHMADNQRNSIGVEIVDPGTPIYVVLILDVSSGMANVIDDMKRAVETAVDSAHVNVYFAVMQFDTTWQLLHPFSNNTNQVKAAILQVAAGGAGVCLHNALYAGLDLLAQQQLNPQDRQAIFLFASGKDQRSAHSNEPCSVYSIDQITAFAQHQDDEQGGIPIHTIGLFDQTRGNLDQQNLQRLADETRAFSAIGGSSQLGDLFKEIMGGLSSQLMARASVPAQAGSNQGQLILANRNGAVVAQADFSFNVSQSYTIASSTTARVDISSVQYYADRNSYELRLNVANPEALSQLVVSVWDTRGGVQIGSDYTFANPGSMVIANIDARNFDAEREYAFRVQAVDRAGFLIEGERGGTVLVERDVQHRPETAEPVSFTIQSVNVDRDNGILTIMLGVSETGQVGWYDGFIVDESGQEVARFAQTSFPGSRIEVDLPGAIETAVQQHRYTLNLYLYTQDGLRSEQTREFSPSPPPRPGFFARIWLGLTSNPFILISIIVIVVSVSAWLYLRNKKKPKKDNMPRPPVSMTRVADKDFRAHGISNIEQIRKRPPKKSYLTPQQNKSNPSTPSMPSLYMELIESPSPQKMPKRATKFPYTIGREGCDLNIVGDRRVSRRHLCISRKRDSLYITDLGSSNGTYLDGSKLVPSKDTLLSSRHELRIGSQTILNLEVGK